DGAAVPGTFAFYQMLNPNVVNIKVKGKSGGEKVVPMHHPAKGEPVVNWAWLFEPGQVIAFGLDNPTYGVSQPAALLYPTNSIALVSASVWPTNPKYLEIYLELRVNQDCTDCSIENIAVLDLSRNSWLSPVTPDHVAWALYPIAGQAPNLMAIPPPVALGYTGTTTSTGTFNAQRYGNK